MDTENTDSWFTIKWMFRIVIFLMFLYGVMVIGEKGEPTARLNNLFTSEDNPDSYTLKNGLADHTNFLTIWSLILLILPLLMVLVIIPFGWGIPKKIVETNLLNYLLHILTIFFISGYTMGIHHKYPGLYGAYISLFITGVMAFGQFMINYIPEIFGSTYLRVFSNTFRSLLLSRQISSINIILLLTAIIWAYIKYSNLKSRIVTANNPSGEQDYVNNADNADDINKSVQPDNTNLGIEERKKLLRVSGTHIACDWHKMDSVNGTTKIIILIICFIIMLYPLMLSWRTYSLKDSTLGSNTIVLFLFGLLMVLFFWDIPSSLFYSMELGIQSGDASGTKTPKIDMSFSGVLEPQAANMKNDYFNGATIEEKAQNSNRCDDGDAYEVNYIIPTQEEDGKTYAVKHKEKNIIDGDDTCVDIRSTIFKSKIQKNIEVCNKVHRTNYFASVGFNYLIWLLLGIMFELLRMWRLKTTKAYNITFVIDALKNFLINLLMIFGTFFSTFFGGSKIWKE